MLLISTEVRRAIAAGQAVVALESSIVAHGFPHPQNLAVGRALGEAVRRSGAVPAMMAVLGGRVHIGLDDEHLVRLATGGAAKCSTRDLAFVIASGGDGATTVAATARLAALAGIRVFATGGIGGVHRRSDPVGGGPAQGAFGADVSADLVELARTGIAVVTAGAKSILDLPATMEVLESLGVALVGYGTDEFPAFHSRESGLPLRQRVDDVAGLARLLRAHFGLGLPGAVLICNPPPAEVAMPRAAVEALIAQALAQARAATIAGAAVTPFLLAALDRLSDGRTTEINHALAVSNAELAGRLAVALLHHH